MRRSISFTLILALAISLVTFFLIQPEEQAPSSDNSEKPAAIVQPDYLEAWAGPEDLEMLTQPELPQQFQVPISPDTCGIPRPQTVTPPVLTLEQWAAIPEFRPVKNIVPPIAGLDAPAQSVLLDERKVREGGIIAMGAGAFLHLPPGALVDEAGNPVTGPVKISYCQLNNPLDILLSGVPMQYDSAGSTSTFTSAGMFRIEARTADGGQVQLRAGETMRIDMPTVDTADTYNFYTFDENAGGWRFTAPSAPARPAVDLIADTLLRSLKLDFDTTPFAAKFQNLNYHGVVCRKFSGRENTPYLYVNRNGALTPESYYGVFRGASYRYTRRIKLHVLNTYQAKGDQGDREFLVRFKIGFNGKSARLFPELAALRYVTFVADDCQSLREFYSKYRRGRNIHDIRVEYEEGSEFCTLLLKDEKEIISLRARISDRTGKALSRNKRSFYRAYGRYTRLLKMKEDYHDGRVRQQIRGRIFQVFRENNIALYANYRQLYLPGFATYNCDQIARMRQPEYLAARLERPDSTECLYYTATVYDFKARASFFFYAYSPVACSRGGFGFALINDLSRGEQYLLRPDNGIRGSFPEQARLIEIPENCTREELMALIGMNG